MPCKDNKDYSSQKATQTYLLLLVAVECRAGLSTEAFAQLCSRWAWQFRLSTLAPGLYLQRAPGVMGPLAALSPPGLYTLVSV